MSKTKNRGSKPQSSEPPAPAAATAPPPSGPGPSSLSLLARWFFSADVRHASAMRKHVEKLLNHQRDILSPQAIEAIQKGLRDLRDTLAGQADKAALE